MNVHDSAARLVQWRAAQLERACEEALQTGTMGVLILDDRLVSSGTHVELLFNAGPDPSVPYGTIQRRAPGL